MRQRRQIGPVGIGVVSAAAVGVALASSVPACSESSNGAAKTAGKAKDAGTFDGPIFTLDGSRLSITPSNPQVEYDANGKPQPIQFTVTGAGNNTVQWVVSNPAIGMIDENGVFTPSATSGGEGDIEVHVGGAVVKVHIVVKVQTVQNGDSQATEEDAGAGGIGGVGGDGFGGPVPDDVLAVLKGTPTADASLKLLYPYDQTVFPLDVLPPLYQWTKPTTGTVNGVYVHFSAPPYYDYKGYFAKPAAAKDFIRHPIPKDVWKGATESAAGSTLSVELVFAVDGKAVGPLQQTYKIALAPLNGVIYYQAYATAFVQNWSPELTVWKERFGGATLSIQVGAEAPKLVAGTTTDDHSGCRVCHSVSAYGDRMVVQHGDDYAMTSSYDLKNGNQETVPTVYKKGTLGWAGLYPDGTMGLANSIDVTGSDSNQGDTKLYDMKTGNVIPSPGLNEFATQIGLPAFSPDGKHAAFTLYEGPSTPAIGAADGRKLVMMDFDLATKSFSNPKLLWDSKANDQRPAFLTFMPNSDAVVFQRRWDGTNGDLASSWFGSKAELWWVDLATGQTHTLDRANGIGTDGKLYLPTAANDHQTDNQLNYDPSISPVASGGYAWMVFMSRRLYGNVATSAPWDSDPRQHDIRTDIATKKLWMAAIDLNAKPGTDPSHPAFYIPGQELKGINSRPFFALQPCVTDRGTCRTGVDCCTGFCRDGLCQPPPVNECSKIDEKCSADGDCCDVHARCLAGFCEIILR